MADTCDVNESDLLGSRLTCWLLWRVPQITFVAGFFVAPTLRTLMWPASLGTVGAACLANATRCGRVHCYFTGPFYVAMAAVSLAYGLDRLPLGAHGWEIIAVVVLVGGLILSYVPERILGQYTDVRIQS